MNENRYITYGYDSGGNLNTFAGDKKTRGTGESHTQYLQSLLYDKFEQRTYLKLGNGVETNYTYRPDNRRLKNLSSAGAVAGKFQNLAYSYDPVGNITDLANKVAIPAPNTFGGPTTQHFGYDDLYRLTHADGNFKSSPGKLRDYTLDLAYSDIHNIVSKTQTDTVTNAGGSAIPQKATSYDWAYAYAGTQPHAPTHIGSHTFSYDADGNQTGWTDDKNGTRRIMLWDEDNRLMEIDDNGQHSRYTYDDKGERVIKTGRQGETVYVNQYYVVRNRSIVSKHLFAGTSRLVTKLVMGTAAGNGYKGAGTNGGGQGSTSANAGQDKGNQGLHLGQDKQNPGQADEHRNAQASDAHGNTNAPGKGESGKHGNAANTPSPLAGEGGGEGVDATNLPGNSEKGLENALANGQGNKYGIYKRLDKLGDTVDASGEIVPVVTGSGTTPTGNGQSDFTYYYHPDHLGSTGYVTDANGKLYEHLEYFPFGETWVQEHSNTLRTPYLFTGKEFDQETGLYYFGARYYDPRTSVWQSADPILGKYLPSGNKDHDSNLAGMGGIYNPLNIGLYGYAAQNPVKFSDPDGRAFGIDDVVGAVVGGLINLSIQGWKDILSGGEGTYGESAGAFTSGAIAGVAAVNIPETAGASVTAIAAGGASAAGNAVQQGVDKGVNNIDLKEVATHGVLGAALGGVLHKLIPNTPIPGLSSGRNSAKAVAEGVKTKIARGTARIMSATTAAKAAAGSKAADAVRGVVADKAEDEAAHMLHHEDQKAEPHHED